MIDGDRVNRHILDVPLSVMPRSMRLLSALVPNVQLSFLSLKIFILFTSHRMEPFTTTASAYSQVRIGASTAYASTVDETRK